MNDTPMDHRSEQGSDLESRNLGISKSRNLEISISRKLEISELGTRKHDLGISESRKFGSRNHGSRNLETSGFLNHGSRNVESLDLRITESRKLGSWNLGILGSEL